MRTRTMLMFKPDCMSDSSLFAHILGRVADADRQAARHLTPDEDSQWVLEAGCRMILSQEMATRLYAVHAGKDFHEALIRFTTSGPVFVSIWSCETPIAWEVGRTIVNEIRWSYGRCDTAKTGPANLMHGSDSEESAKIEVAWATEAISLAMAGGEACG